MEGKTPEITIEQARTLLASVDTRNVVGLRDRAMLATMAYSIVRAGAVAKLRVGDFQHDGTQYMLRFQEKGGKNREIPVRHDLEGFIRPHIDAAGIAGRAKDSPLFRATKGRLLSLSGRPMKSKTVGEVVKRRLKDAGLPLRLSPHSFRVSGLTALLSLGKPLGGCAKPRRALRSAYHAALRPAEESGDTEHCRKYSYFEMD
jgi:integrase/recombinase XerD